MIALERDPNTQYKRALLHLEDLHHQIAKNSNVSKFLDEKCSEIQEIYQNFHNTLIDEEQKKAKILHTQSCWKKPKIKFLLGLTFLFSCQALLVFDRVISLVDQYNSNNQDEPRFSLKIAALVSFGLLALNATREVAEKVSYWHKEREAAKEATFKKQLEHIKIASEFLKKLSKIHKIKENFLKKSHTPQKEEPHIFSDENQVNKNRFDEKIKKCLKIHETLPKLNIEPNTRYCVLVSHLIQVLPREDPLKQGLSGFSPDERAPLYLPPQDPPIQYLPKLDKRISSISEIPGHKPQVWQVEEANGTIIEIPENPKKLQNPVERQQQFMNYGKELNQRFGVQENNLTFLITEDGWRIKQDGNIEKKNSE